MEHALDGRGGTPVVEAVVPTIGRPQLDRLLAALAGQTGPLPRRILVVDDRPQGARSPWHLDLPTRLLERVEALRSGGRGPAAARNVGWRESDAEWIAFLDDDVVPEPRWAALLLADLDGVSRDVAAVQGRIRVPLPSDRRPTDWERNVARLETARWITADMAIRREALEEVGGFDERFSRAYREDTDLALRISALGHRLVQGERRVLHPVRPASRWISVSLQRGNADDALMDAIHGRWDDGSRWAFGTRRSHVATTAAGVVALAAMAAGWRRLARAAVAAWGASTAALAWKRIRPGPRDRDEIVTMVVTSVAIPPAATYWWLVGLVRRRSVLSGRQPAPAARSPASGSAGRGARTLRR